MSLEEKHDLKTFALKYQSSSSHIILATAFNNLLGPLAIILFRFITNVQIFVYPLSHILECECVPVWCALAGRGTPGC